MKTASLHGQENVARGDAGTAITDDPFGRYILEDFGEPGAQRVRRIEQTAAVELRLPVEVARPRNVSGYRIERLRRADVSLGSSRIDQTPTRVAVNAFDEAGIDGRPTIDLARIRANGAGVRDTGFRRRTQVTERSPTTVDHRKTRVADCPQHPPGASSRHPAARIVVENDLIQRGDAPVSETRKPEVEGRKGVTASGRWVRRYRKIGFQVDAKGASKVGRFIGLGSPGSGASVEKNSTV